MKTKILLLTPVPEGTRPSAMSSYVSIFAANVNIALSGRSNIELTYETETFKMAHSKRKPEIAPYLDAKYDDGSFDHVIALGLQVLNKYPIEVYAVLRNKVHQDGKVCQFYDSGKKHHPKCDLMFVHRIFNTRNPKNCYVNWAVDPAVFISKQQSDTLTCFVDHNDFKPQGLHLCYSNKIMFRLKQLYDSGLWQQKYRNFRVLTLTNEGVAEINMNDITPATFSTLPELYHRKNGVPQHELAEYLGSSHVFFPTHGETLGITVAEAAMSGCLIVTQPGHITPDRLATVKHNVVDFDQDVNWQCVLSAINPIESCEQSMDNTFDRMLDRVCGFLEIVNE